MPTPYFRDPATRDAIDQQQSEAEALNQQAAANAHAAERQARQQAANAKSQQREVLRTANIATEADLQAQNRPQYTDAAGVIKPQQSDEQWTAQQAAKATAAAQKAAFAAEGRPYAVNPIDKSITPLKSDAEMQAAKAARAEALRKKSVTDQINGLKTEANDPALRSSLLNTTAHKNATKELTKAKEAARNALLSKSLQQSKATTGGNDWIPFNEKPAPEAAAAAEQAKRLADPAQDLNEQDLAALEADPATAPMAAKIKGLGGVLSKHEEAAKFHGERQSAIWDAEMRRDNPAKWEAMRREKVLTDPKAFEASQAEFAAKQADLTNKIGAVQQKRQQTAEELAAIEADNATRVADGIPVTDLIHLQDAAGNPVPWSKELAAKHAALTQQHGAWEKNNTDQLETLDLEHADLQKHAALLTEAAKVHTARQQNERTAGLEALAKKPGMEGYAHALASLDQEHAARAADINEMYPEDSPEKQSAMSALQGDIEAKAKNAGEAAQQKRQAGTQLYQNLKEFNPEIDWTKPEGGQNDIPQQMIQRKAAELGLTPDEAKAALAQSKAEDWSVPHEPGILEKVGVGVPNPFAILPAIRGDKELASKTAIFAPTLDDLTLHFFRKEDVAPEQFRILPDGNLSINPALTFSPDGYKKAVENSGATPEAKAEALARRDVMAAQGAEEALPLLSTTKEFPAYVEAQKQKDPAFANLTPAAQAAKFMEQRDSRNYSGKVWDQIRVNIGSAMLGIAQMVTGTVTLATGSDAAREATIALGAKQQKNAQQLDVIGSSSDRYLRTGGSLLNNALQMAPTLGMGAVAGRMATFGSKLAAAARGAESMSGFAKAFGEIGKMETAANKAGMTMFNSKVTETAMAAGSGLGEGLQQAAQEYPDAYKAYYDQLARSNPEMSEADRTKAAHKAALLPVLTSAFTTAVIGYLGGGSGAEAILRKGGTDGAKTGFFNLVRNVLKTARIEAPKEAAEEFWQTAASDLNAQATYNPQSKVGDIAGDIVESAFQGALLGGGFAGAHEVLGAMAGAGKTDTGPQAPVTPHPANLPERVAAAETAIDGFTAPDLDPATIARTQDAARAVLYIAQGSPLTDLPADSLAALDIVENPEKPGTFVNGKVEAAKDGTAKLVTYDNGQVGDPATGAVRPVRVRIDEKGNAIISQGTLDKIETLMPAVRQAIPLDENARTQQIDSNGSGTNQSGNPDNGQTAGGTSKPAVQGGVQAAAGKGADAARSGQAAAQPVGGGTTAVLPSKLDAPQKKRATELANALVDLGLPDGPAARVGEAVVARHGVVGESYTEQFVSPEFRAALKELGISGALSASKAKENPLVAAPDFNDRISRFGLSESDAGKPGSKTSAGKAEETPVQTGLGADNVGASPSSAPNDPFAPVAKKKASQSAASQEPAKASTPTAEADAPAGIDGDEYLAARQAALKATKPDKRKGALKALTALDVALSRYGKAFDAVKFGPVSGGGLVVTRKGKKATLEIDLGRWLQQHSGIDPKNIGTAARAELEEEFIHRAATNVFTDADMAGFFRSLPRALAERVYEGYHKADIENKTVPAKLPDAIGAEQATVLGHEFLRMLVQDSQFAGRVSEAVAADPSFGEKIIAFLRDLVKSLRKMIDAADVDTRVTIAEYEKRVSNEVARLQKLLPSTPAQMLKAKETPISQSEDKRKSVTAGAESTAARPDFKPAAGSTGTAFTDGNDAIEYEWAVVDAESLNISNRDDGTINPEYPQELQPRDRTSAGSEAQVADIAKNANLDRLSESSGVGDGAPFTGPDGVVESGNGRLMGLRRAYQRGMESVLDYRQKLIDTASRFGLTAEQVKATRNPVLVRVRRTNVDRTAFVLAANVSTIAPKREIEQAKIDAKQITPDIFDTFVPSDNGDIFTAANAQFIQSFVSAVVPPAERPAVIDARGNLSQAGLRRIRNALFVHAYGESKETLNALAGLTESLDEGSKNLAGALVAIAPRFAEQNSREASGALYPLSITGDLAWAVQQLADLGKRGESVKAYLAQDFIPGIGDGPEPMQARLLEYLDENRARPAQMLATLRRYASAVDGAGDPKQASLFGESRPTREELWDIASKAVGSGTVGSAALALGTKALEPKVALKVYRQLKSIEAERGTLEGPQAAALYRAERSLGQTFLFDVEPTPEAAFRLEQQTTGSGQDSGTGRLGDAEQLSLFTGTKSKIPFIQPLENARNEAILQGHENASATDADSFRNPAIALGLVQGKDPRGTATRGPGERASDGSADGLQNAVGRGLAALPELDPAALRQGLDSIPPADRYSGNEHTVFHVRDVNRALKFTEPGQFGARGGLEPYLGQLVEANRRFDDGVAVEGWVRFPGEPGPRMVTSQPWVGGRESTLPEIDTYMRRKGFLRLFDGAWWHPGAEVQVTDALPKNFKTSASGHVHPVDLILAWPSLRQQERIENIVNSQTQPEPTPEPEGESGVPLAAGTKASRREALSGAETTVQGQQVKTGVPVTFQFLHNQESATGIYGKPKKDSDFDRGFEPSGRFVTETTSPWLADEKPEQYIKGELTFQNPIVLDAGEYGTPSSWKRKLSAAFGGKRGKSLSKAIITDGYDGVITAGKYGPGEILDLTTFDEAKALYAGTKKNTEQPRNLAAVHNLSIDNLRHVLKMGGLAVPSLAVIRSDRSTFDNFGEITLVAPPSLVDPQENRQSKVFNADVYSPRYPQVTTILKPGDGRKLSDFFDKWREETLPAIPSGAYSWSSSKIADDIKTEGFGRLKDNPLVTYGFLRSKGEIEPPAAGIEDYKYRDELRKLVSGREPELEMWLRNRLSDLKIYPEEKIFNGFTYSGNKRYLPHNLDTVVKLLKKELKDGEGYNYGVPSIRAAYAKPFRSLKAIQENRDHIIPEKEMEALKEEVNQEFETLANEILPMRSSGREGFGAQDAFSDDMKAMVQGGGENMRHLREMYPGADAYESVFKPMRAFLDKLRHMPTEYFESKVQRVVHLTEFSGAVVPDDTPKDLIDALEQRKGLEVVSYPRNDKPARAKAVQDMAERTGALFAGTKARIDAAALEKLLARAPVIESRDGMTLGAPEPVRISGSTLGDESSRTDGMAPEGGAAQNANEPSPGGLSEAEVIEYHRSEMNGSSYLHLTDPAKRWFRVRVADHANRTSNPDNKIDLFRDSRNSRHGITQLDPQDVSILVDEPLSEEQTQSLARAVIDSMDAKQRDAAIEDGAEIEIDARVKYYSDRLRWANTMAERNGGKPPNNEVRSILEKEPAKLAAAQAWIQKSQSTPQGERDISDRGLSKTGETIPPQPPPSVNPNLNPTGAEGRVSMRLFAPAPVRPAAQHLTNIVQQGAGSIARYDSVQAFADWAHERRRVGLAKGTVRGDSTASYDTAPTDTYTGAHSLITGSRVTREQGQAIGARHAERLRRGLRSGGEGGANGGALAASRGRAFVVPVLTAAQFDKLTSLDEIGEGSEATVYADKAAGVVYKVLSGHQGSPTLGIWPEVYYTADGKLDYRFMPATKPRQLGARIAVQTLLGGTPTEFAGIGPRGQVILKQPLSPDADLMGIAQADEESMALGGPEMAQRVATAISTHDAGLVQIPKGMLLDQEAVRPYVVVVEGRPWMVTDVRTENFVGDNQGEARINDPVVANIPGEMIARVPGLAAVVTEAGQQAARLGDRSARLFAATKAMPEELRTQLDSGTVAERHVWRKNAEGGQTIGNRQAIVRADEQLFKDWIKPRIRRGFAKNLTEYEAKVGMEAHLSFVDAGRGWELSAIGPVWTLRPGGRAAKWAMGVKTFDDPEGEQFRQVADSSPLARLSASTKAKAADETGRRIQQVLHTNAAMKILSEESTAQSGPFDGGCLICAKAIQQAIGGDLVRIDSDVNGRQAEHYGLRKDGKIYDADGSYGSPQEWIEHFREAELVNDRQLSFATGFDPQSEIPDDARATKEIAKLLVNRLGSVPLAASSKSPTLPVSPSSPSPLARLGWNHADKALSAKVAAHTRWLRDSAGETVARWQGKPNAAPFMALGKLLKRELFPDSILPREIAAKKREMEIKTSIGAQKGMDLVRALTGTPKFSDMAYPEEFSKNPMHRRNLYLAMTGESPMSALPHDMQALGAKLRKMLVEMGREAVKQGRMSTDTFAALEQGYMPHYYKEDVQKEKSLFHRFRLGVRDILAQRTTAWHIVDMQNKDPRTGEPRLVSWQGNQWRFRNQEHRDAFFEDFLLQQALDEITNRNGKKNRSLTLADLRAPAALDAETRGRLAEIKRNLQMRYKKEKPLSVDEQEKAGLIMDPVYAIARYTAQMVHDNSTAEFFNFVAGNKEWVSDNASPGFAEIPDNPRFGRLASKYVTDDVAAQILEMVEAPNQALQIYDTILGWWKTGKTIYNIGTHVRNVLSNLFFAQLAGSSLHNPGNIRYYKSAITSLRNGGSELMEAYEMGVLGADFVSAELRQTLRQLLPDPSTINETDGKAEGILMGIGKSIGRIVPQWAANPLHKFHNSVTALYQVEDEVFKLAAYLKARGMGMSKEEARDHVRQWFPFFDQGSSGSLKTLGRTAMPFLGFYRQSIRIFGEAVKHRPIALAGGMAIPSLITLLSAFILGLEDDDMEEIKKDMRGKAGKLLGPTPLGGLPLFSMLLPKRSSTGEVQQFDLSGIYPFTDILGTRVEGVEGQGWWQQMWRAFISGGPLQSLAYANALNIDSFSNKEIIEPGMGTGEALQKRFENAYQTLMPPLAPGIPLLAPAGGQNIETLSKAGALPWQEAQRGADKTLRERSPTQAVARAVFGIDVRPGSPDIYRQADDWRKAKGYEVIEGMDYGSTTPASRARKALFATLAQDNPNLNAVKNITKRLKEMGHPVETPKDIQQLLFFKDPAHLIGGNKKLGIEADDARRQFRASLNGESRRLYDDAISTFQRIKARAPALIMQAQMAP